MDLRVQKTYSALISAFTALLSRERYEKISVAALCSEATIRRTTFYKHFRDKDDFFVFFIKNLRAEFLQPEDPAGAYPSWDRVTADRKEIIRQLADFLLEHEQLMQNIFESTMSGTMALVICDVVADILRERYPQNEEAEPGEPGGSLPVNAAAEFAAGGIVRLMQLWWQSGHLRDGEDDFIESADRLVGRIMEN